MTKEIIIGSRGSKLALFYAQMAKDKIIENTELDDGNILIKPIIYLLFINKFISYLY